MKKIFTFLFFVSAATIAMAQNSRNAQYRGQGNGNNQQPAYSNNGPANGGYGQSNNGYGQPGQQAQPNNSYQQNNDHRGYDQPINRGNDYGNNNPVDDRRFGDRDFDHGFHDDDRFHHRDFVYERGSAFRRYDRGRFDTRVVIRFGHPYRF